MMKVIFILLCSIVLAGTVRAQAPAGKAGVKKNKPAKLNQTTGIKAIALPANDTIKDSIAAVKKVQEVLFATNEDCDLYINDEYKGTAAKSNFKYLKLAPGTYTYKAKSKTTFDEVKESFRVNEEGLNEVFIDLLYACQLCAEG